MGGEERGSIGFQVGEDLKRGEFIQRVGGGAKVAPKLGWVVVKLLQDTSQKECGKTRTARVDLGQI